MSFLTPLYVLGLSAVVAPIVFHLIRRSPRGEVPFSSLMFLAPTPPRLTRRSRLDHLLLLCLRAAALCLLAFAFARPFLRQAARAGLRRRRAAPRRPLDRHQCQHAPRRPVATGSTLAGEVIADCRPADQLAVFSFDATTQPLLELPRVGDTRPGPAAGGRPGADRSPGPVLGRDEPGPGPDRRCRRDRRRGRHQRESRPDAAPGGLDQRPRAGQPAGGAGRLRVAL